MRVLVSAYACEPGRGAEPGVGWNLVRQLSQENELWVLTRADHREKVLQCGEEWIDRVHWVFIDPPGWLTFWKEGSRGLYPFYALWQIEAWKAAKKLHVENKFEVVHHLTFGQYWVPTRLAELGPPFVFGPVGGGESTPPGFAEHYSLRGKIRELIRDAAREWLPMIPFFRRLYLGASWSLAATRQTASALQQVGVTDLSVLPQSGIGDGDECARFIAERGQVEKLPTDVLKIVSACRLVHWKAVDLAIEAVGRAHSAGVPVKFEILSEGPEVRALKRLAERLNLQEVVTFRGKLPQIEDVFREVSESDALIHPALHEAFGQSCLEAMALGTPVICLDWAGPGMIVSDETGYAVTPSGREETIDRLAEAIANCYQDKVDGREKGPAAAQRALEKFSWSGLADEIRAIYQKVTADR